MPRFLSSGFQAASRGRSMTSPHQLHKGLGVPRGGVENPSLGGGDGNVTGGRLKCIPNPTPLEAFTASNVQLSPPPRPGAQGPGGSGGHPIPGSGAQAYTLPDGDHGDRNDSFFSGRTARRRLCAEFPRADPHTGAGIHFFTQKNPQKNILQAHLHGALFTCA